nr:hypothetical protein [uncultured Dialister sp.]
MSKSKVLLSNTDFLKLFGEEKLFEDTNAIFPAENESVSLPAVGISTKEKYLMDINRKRCTLTRITYQQRAKKTILMLRLDIDTKPHKNPDDTIIPGTHLHIYQEGYNDAWAYPLDSEELNNILKCNFDFKKLISMDQEARFNYFCKLCNFTNYPLFQIPLDIH